MFEREESKREPPYGAALDLGCGSGVWGVPLAQRGWQVTSVDIVEKALQRARERVREVGVDVRVVHADVTDLRAAGIGSDFRLVLDTGTFHGLTDDQREAMGREVSAVASSDATVLLDVFALGAEDRCREGRAAGDVEAAFPGWTVTAVEVADSAPDAIARRLKFDEHWYRLRRE